MAPPTSWSAPYDPRERHRQRSRTPSPSNRPSLQTYRLRNMYHANVFVDQLGHLPSAIDAEARRILAIDSWSHVVSVDNFKLDALATSFQAQSQRNARECSLEGDWKISLYSVMRSVTDLWPGALKTHMTGELWNTNLKPTGSSLDKSQFEDHAGASTPRLITTQSALPVDAAAIEETISTFAGSVPSLPLSSRSTAWTTSTEAADPYHISTPKPDIAIGLDHASFSESHQLRLVDYQASMSILSDPHIADIGMRFPFLIVEVKGLSLTGGLVAAQNQAAIGAAFILTILKDLTRQAAWNAEASCTLSNEPTPPTLCFSIVTEGPAHELSVHLEHEGAVHMEPVKSWRTTYEHDARELVCCLARVMEWGVGRFRERVVDQLERVPKHVLVA